MAPPSEGAVRIRAAVSADAGFIFECIRSLAVYEKLEHEVTGDVETLESHLFGARRFAEALIVELDGVAAGYALFFHTYSTFLTKPGLFLEDLFVMPERRGRGLGKALLLYLAAEAESRECGRLEWSVLDWNEPAIAFYRSIGARPVDGWTAYRLTGRALADAASAAGS